MWVPVFINGGWASRSRQWLLAVLQHTSQILLLFPRKTVIPLLSVMKRGKGGQIFVQTQVLSRDSSVVPQSTGFWQVNTLVLMTLLQIHCKWKQHSVICYSVYAIISFICLFHTKISDFWKVWIRGIKEINHFRKILFKIKIKKWKALQYRCSTDGTS